MLCSILGLELRLFRSPSASWCFSVQLSFCSVCVCFVVFVFQVLCFVKGLGSTLSRSPSAFGGSLSSQCRFLCVVGAVFCRCCGFVLLEPCRYRPPVLGFGFGCLAFVARKS